jgi:FkbM family methyltransferase
MSDMLYKLFSFVMRTFSSNVIVNKPMDGFNKRLYYEKLQHLSFMFRNRISYEANIWNNIRPFICEGDLIFDIGGNIGQYALRFSEATGDRGKVISFEPDYKNFAFLHFNCNINACKNIECKNIGLGAKAETLEIYRDTELGGRMSSFNVKYVANKFKGFSDFVNVETFDGMTNIYGVPEFVKIDVEGYELEVLKGIHTFSENTKYLVEVRDDTKKSIFDVFSEHGFKCFVVDDSKPWIVERKDIVPSFSNLLFVHEKQDRYKFLSES